MLIKRLKIVLPLCFLSTCFCVAQKYLVMDVSKLTGFKRIRFSTGDDFRFRKKNERKKYTATIVYLTDSMIVFKDSSVKISDIAIVYRDRSNFVTRGLSRWFLGLGVGFVALDTFNNAINNESPVVKKEAVIESASFLAAGLLLKALPIKRYRMGKRRSLKIIDLSP